MKCGLLGRKLGHSYSPAIHAKLGDYSYGLFEKTEEELETVSALLTQAETYAAAKEGIRGLSRVAAAEWGPDGIRVNVICPLAMTESLQEWKVNYPELFEKTIQGIPMGRFADPKDDIGRVAVFLASEDAHYVTGETITLQGGSGLRP